MKKNLFILFPGQLLTLLTATLFILLPSINSDGSIQDLTSGKMFFFLYLILVAGLLLLLKTFVFFPTRIQFSKMDGILLIWAVYILLNGLIHQIPLSNRLLEFYGLIFLYIVLRQIEPSKCGILLAAMVIGSAIQAIYGSLQLWGFYPSHHSLFKMSGSFFNPGPFAGYLASIFPVTLGLYIFKINPFPIIDKKLDLANWIAGITLIAILMVLPASQSRAAWMAVIVSSLMILMIRYPVGLWLKKYSWLKRGIVLLLVCGIIGASLFGLLRFKTDSANGRLLIWKVTLSMVANHPLTGVGFDRFKTFYMNEQAGYFEQTPDSPEAMVAGDTNYCFNEFLQHTAENGLIGLLLLLAILAYAFRVTNKRFNNLLWIAKAGIGGIAVFALFSYPAQILPIKANLIAYLACISTLAEGKKEWIFIKKQAPIKYTLAVFSVGIIIICTVNLSIYRVACNNWKQAYQLHTRGYYAESLNYYEKGWSVLKTNGDYLTQYGKALNLAGKHEQAIKILQQAVKYFPNIVVYTALGDSYKAQEKSGKAEQAYLRAWYMNPSRFYPKYLLAKLYDETGQAEKAIAIATELLNKEVKIESTAIDEIKAEMKKILQKYLGSPVGFKLQKWRSP